MYTGKRILVIEDDDEIRSNIEELLQAEGYATRGASNGVEGLSAVKTFQPDAVLCDVMMPELDGLGVLAALRNERATQTLPFVFLTAKSDRSDMRAAMNLGADDYLTKPFVRAELLEALRTRLRRVDEMRRASSPPPPPASKPTTETVHGGYVVSDPRMAELHRLVEQIAPGAINVLLLGETGVGKEVFAERVHALSSRKNKPFLRLNSSAFTETLLESELFGHEKGAFTGASAAKAGLLESADGGTVFLDEFGELPLTVQAKLLRVLEERAVRRVGAVRPRAIDVRFVAATNRDLQAEIAAGRFRADLFFRLNGATLVIPPLRERAGEIESLAQLFLSRAWQPSTRASPARLEPTALSALRRYHWPGNIRELRNVIERAVLLAPDGVILPEHLALGTAAVATTSGGVARNAFVPSNTGPPVVAATPSTPAIPAAERAPPGERTSAPSPSPESFRSAMATAEREQIEAALSACGGNQTQAAKLLGVSRRTLINKIEQYDIPRPRKG